MVEEDNKPETEEKPETETEHTPPVVDPPVHKEDTSVIEALRAEVAELRGEVDTLVTQSHRDETPSSRPWTHRGGRR